MEGSNKDAPWKLVSAADEALRSFTIDGDGEGYRQLVDVEFEENPEMIIAGSYTDWQAITKEFIIDHTFGVGEAKRMQGLKLTLAELVMNVKSGKCKRHTTLLGSAGSGKTTILKRFARDIRGSGKPSENHIKLVIVLDFRKLPEDEMMSPRNAILGRIFSSYKESDMKAGFKWLIANQTKFVFLLDSLDTIPFSLEAEHRQIDYKAEETPGTILYNLLAGCIFPDTTVISSSRESKVANLPSVIQPQICILLCGFTWESVVNASKGLLGYKLGTEVLEYIHCECPDIVPLLSSPAFLVYSLIAFQQRDGFKPNSMSGILLRVLLNYVHSSGAGETDVKSTFGKLMVMAHDGMLQRRVLFTTEDLQRSNLSSEEIKALSFVIPQSQSVRLPSRLLINEHSYTYFNHQSGQEFLAGMYCQATSSADDFKQFLDKELNQPDFSVVKKTLFGMMLDKNVFEASNEINGIIVASEKKRQMLLQLLEDQWRNAKNSSDRLDWFQTVQECREGALSLIRRLLKRIDVHGQMLDNHEIYAIGFVMKYAKSLDMVDISNCNLDLAKCRTLLTATGNSPAQVTFDLANEGKYLKSKFVRAIK